MNKFLAIFASCLAAPIFGQDGSLSMEVNSAMHWAFETDVEYTEVLVCFTSHFDVAAQRQPRGEKQTWIWRNAQIDAPVLHPVDVLLTLTPGDSLTADSWEIQINHGESRADITKRWSSQSPPPFWITEPLDCALLEQEEED